MFPVRLIARGKIAVVVIYPDGERAEGQSACADLLGKFPVDFLFSSFSIAIEPRHLEI